MQYTTHYNLNLPEGTDIVNPLIQDNPNYSAIDTALYDNKLRVIGNATHVKTGTNHAITLTDSDIAAFKFVATGDYATGDTFSVDGVTVTARVANGSSIPTGAFRINSTVEAILDGTILNLINVDGTNPATAISYDNTSSGLNATNVQNAIDELAIKGNVSVTADGIKTYGQLLDALFALIDSTKINQNTTVNHQYSATGFDTLNRSQTASDKFTFTCIYVDNSMNVITAALRSTGSTLKISDNGTITDFSSTVASNGTKFTLYY